MQLKSRCQEQLTYDDFKNIDHLNNILNAEVIKISTWLKINQLSLNVSKLQFMIFHKTALNLNTPELIIDNIP